jgi:prepilin-type N-terminal cleavage/methylation domain-containing protein
MRKTRRAFSLIELLVVVAIIAAVIGILVPTLSSVRAAGRDLRCLTNLRSLAAAWQLYAVDHDDLTPALGVPWASAPNWSIVVMEYAGRPINAVSQLPSDGSSVLVCPRTQRHFPEVEMTRTYAANVTGFAGAQGDRGDFDEEPTFARFSRVRSPSMTPMLLDSAPILPGPGLPPPSRTASVIDFRESVHVDERIGRVHGESDPGGFFHVAFYDGSAHREDTPPDSWRVPINE